MSKPMVDVSRRNLLAGTASAAVVALMPAIPALALARPAADIPLTPMWAVGTEDDWNWLPIAAPDEETARRVWVSETVGGMSCKIVEEGGETQNDCDCDWCTFFRGARADRQPAWDGKTVVIGDENWLDSGLGACCKRCAHETSAEEGARSLDGVTLCESCLTLEDWDRIDPLRAAELREIDQ